MPYYIQITNAERYENRGFRPQFRLFGGQLYKGKKIPDVNFVCFFHPIDVKEGDVLMVPDIRIKYRFSPAPFVGPVDIFAIRRVARLKHLKS